MDPRHVAAMVAAGWDQVTNWPASFRRGDDTVVFPLPGNAKWSSNWEYKGQTGRGVGALFKATGDTGKPR